jgi:hypothetical protein
MLRLRFEDCCVSARIGMLSHERLDTWWNFAVNDDPQKRARASLEIRSAMETLAVPFLDLSEARAVAEFLSQGPSARDKCVDPRSEVLRSAYAAVIWRSLGEREPCKSLLDDAVRKAPKTPLRETVEAFVSRFAC